jgi:hypothetical protein
MITMMSEQTMMLTQQSSHQEDSDIQSQTSEIHDLEDKVGFWTGWNIGFVAAAILIASGLFFTQYMLNKRAKSLAIKQSSLIQAKDRQLALDLTNKDLKITTANERASKADESAGKARQRAEELAVKQEELREKNLETETTLENEKKLRLELEKTLAPRRMGIIQDATGKNWAGLIPFSGLQVVMVRIPDFEAARAAGSIAFFIENAGWKVVGWETSTNPPDGVTIETFWRSKRTLLPTSEEFRNIRNEEDRVDKAGAALVDALKKADWQEVRATWATSETLPENTIRISVGFKPYPYFNPQWVKDLEEKFKRQKEEHDRKWNERLGRKPPEK